jgi:ABC-type transport system involved in multi-copper enzyme maturation permease subunit
MNPRAAIVAVSWLVRDTFRQALAARIFWLMLAVNILGIMLCASAKMSGPRTLQPPEEIELYGGDDKPLTGPNPRPGLLTLGFGAFPVKLARGSEAAVHFLLVLLAKWVAGAAGTMLALVWTAGFLPEFLHPSAVSVLLAKPIPRWSLLLGKYLGVLVFMTFQTVLFFVGTWLAMGCRTGIWLPGYLWGIPLLLLHFAIIFSASVMFATYTRSTVTCVFGSIAVWLVCFATNYAYHAAATRPMLEPGAPSSPRAFHWALDTAYWILPKPADLVALLDRALQAQAHFTGIPGATSSQPLSICFTVATSAAFAAVMLGIAIQQLNKTDY